MISLVELSLDQNMEQFNVWSNLPLVRENSLYYESLSRREMLVSELQFRLVRKELIYHRQLYHLHRQIRQSVLWNTEKPPVYLRRQAATIVSRMRKLSEEMVTELERDYNGDGSIVLNLHRLSDLIYKNTSVEFTINILALCDILSELRAMFSRNREDKAEAAKINFPLDQVEKVLTPLQRLVDLKSSLLKICDDLRDQKQLAKAHRALDNVSGVLDRCYEVLSSLHGPSYVADIENILDLSLKSSSLNYRQYKADIVLSRDQLPRMTEFPRLPKPPKVPAPRKNGSQQTGDEEEPGRHCPEDLYELVDIPLDHSCHHGSSSALLKKSFELTPLYQTIASQTSPQLSRRDDDSNDCEALRPGGSVYQRTLWCQLEPVISSGILGSLSAEDRELMEAKFEILSTEVSYLKSLCVLITIFHESVELKKLLTQDEMSALFSNIKEVKEGSERFLDDVVYSLSKDVLMSDVCSLVRVHALTTFRTYLQYCSSQIEILSTFQQIMSGPKHDWLLKVLGNLESSSACQGYSLMSFLSLPLQRVTRLPLLLQTVLKRCPSNTLQGHEAHSALTALQQLVKECNEAVSKPDWKSLHLNKKSAINDNGKIRGKSKMLQFKMWPT